MGVIGRVEVEVDIKSSGDLFFEQCARKLHHFSKITPSNILVSELENDEGDFTKPGSILHIVYNIDGMKCATKKRIDWIDEERKCARMETLEGPFLQAFKNLAINLQVTPKGESSGIKWIIEFEKIHDNGPYPTKIADILIAVTKDIENHHLNA